MHWIFEDMEIKIHSIIKMLWGDNVLKWMHTQM